MRNVSKVLPLSLAFLLALKNAYADVAFHGYGQVVMGTTFSNNRSFPSESQSYSYHADPTFSPNSNFALQAAAPLSNGLSATAQILARGNDDFEPKFHWAFLKYQFNDTFALRAGRLQSPFYQYSDYQFVGEAYPWVLPPEAVYFGEASHYDGLNFSAEKYIGDWFFFLQAIYGSDDETAVNPVLTPSGMVNTNINLHQHNLTGLSLDSSYNEWLSLRAAAFVFTLSVDGDGTPDNLYTKLGNLNNSLASSGYNEAVKALTTSNDPEMYAAVSAQVNLDNWLFIAELQDLRSLADSSGALVDFVSEYATLGYRFGKLLPTATFGHRNQWGRGNQIKKSFPPEAKVLGDAIADGLTGSPGIRAKDYFYELGLRYDLTPNVALKLDYTFYDSHYKTSDFFASEAAAAAAGAVNPQDANRLLAAITFSF
jgi:hypothetical protein